MIHLHTLAAQLGATPPKEFRIFKAGINSTSKGDFIFDATAARLVMAAYAKQGTDLPVDLEHDSLSPERRALRSDAGDARGWFQLSLRGGELWAVNVRWTPDGVTRLLNRTQRYISPAFGADENGRVTQVVNCGLVAHPASYDAPALIAASRSAILSARVTPAARAALYLLAVKRKTTISAVLLSALSTIAEAGSVAPTPDQLTALKSLLDALGLKDAGQPEVLKAITSLLQAAPSDNAAPAKAPIPVPATQSKPKPRSPEPLAQHAEPKPSVQLSRALAARGMTHAQFIAAKAAMPRTGQPKKAT